MVLGYGVYNMGLGVGHGVIFQSDSCELRSTCASYY